MQHVTIALPDELSAALAAPGQDLFRAAFEALALAAYRERKISAAQLRHLLGYETRMEVDAFLKSHGVELEYTLEDLERDRETHRQLGMEMQSIVADTTPLNYLVLSRMPSARNVKKADNSRASGQSTIRVQEAWEALDKTLKAIDLAALSCFEKDLSPHYS
jgi:hypothetical protein